MISPPFSSAGTWLFDRRRWLDPSNTEDLVVLKKVRRNPPSLSLSFEEHNDRTMVLLKESHNLSTPFPSSGIRIVERRISDAMGLLRKFLPKIRFRYEGIHIDDLEAAVYV